MMPRVRNNEPFTEPQFDAPPQLPFGEKEETLARSVVNVELEHVYKMIGVVEERIALLAQKIAELEAIRATEEPEKTEPTSS